MRGDRPEGVQLNPVNCNPVSVTSVSMVQPYPVETEIRGSYAEVLHRASPSKTNVPIRGNSLTYIDFSEADHMCLSYVKGVGKALPYTPEVS